MSANSRLSYDVVICGGGLVGRSLAVALAQLPLQIAILEARPTQLIVQADQDSRSLAISYGNRLFLAQLGIWQFLEASAVPIAAIHVSDRGHYGIARLTAKSQQVSALGYICLAPDLNLALQQAVQQYPNISLICPASLSALSTAADNIELTVQQANTSQQVQTKLAIAADGTHSTIRQLLQIPISQTAYQQTAITANVSIAKAHHNIAYERFTEQGPIALLPLSEQRCGLVWSVQSAQTESLLNLTEDEFLAQLQIAFGYRLGRFTQIGKRFNYALQLLHAQELVRPRAVLVGNAAHTLHPIAGQGFNLGLRDAAALVKIIEQALVNQEDIGSMTVLNRYAQQQTSDQQTYIRFTDGLVKLFSNTRWPLTTARTIGIKALDLISPLKKAFIYKAMGLE